MIIKQEIEWHWAYVEKIPYNKLKDIQPILIIWNEDDIHWNGMITLECWNKNEKKFDNMDNKYLDSILIWAYFEYPTEEAKTAIKQDNLLGKVRIQSRQPFMLR